MNHPKKTTTKMKNIVTILFSLMFFLNISAQKVDSLNQKRIEAFVKSNIYVAPEQVDNAVTSKVFLGTFFKSKLKVSFTPTESSNSTLTGINVHNDSVSKIESCCSNQSFPILLSLIKKDFLLKDEHTAKQFEEALDILYPVREKEIPHVEHMKKGLQWVFIRGSFFDSLQAFIVTTNAEGEVTKIEYKLPYPEE